MSDHSLEEEDQSYPYHEDGHIFVKVGEEISRSVASEEDMQAVEEMIIIFQKELEPFDNESGRRDALKALLPKLIITDIKSARILIKVSVTNITSVTLLSLICGL